eukprot:jgi/Chrzof1/2579/Cz11g21020.t1
MDRACDSLCRYFEQHFDQSITLKAGLHQLQHVMALLLLLDRRLDKVLPGTALALQPVVQSGQQSWQQQRTRGSEMQDVAIEMFLVPADDVAFTPGVASPATSDTDNDVPQLSPDQHLSANSTAASAQPLATHATRSSTSTSSLCTGAHTVRATSHSDFQEVAHNLVEHIQSDGAVCLHIGNNEGAHKAAFKALRKARKRLLTNRGMDLIVSPSRSSGHHGHWHWIGSSSSSHHDVANSSKAGLQHDVMLYVLAWNE